MQKIIVIVWNMRLSIVIFLIKAIYLYKKNIVCPKIPIKLTEDTWNVFDLQGQTMIYPGTLSNINNNDPFHSNKIIPKISDF